MEHGLQNGRHRYGACIRNPNDGNDATCRHDDGGTWVGYG